IYDNKINIMWLTVSLFNKIISENENVFNSLDTILVGGDKLTPNYINKLRSVNKNITIINGYGPTENTTFSTCFTIQKEYKHNIPI
ncbi:AMP-binding protein, partial [Vallitalea longa]|uniref:AMP-binding protein n=1 Tax=Vallitalea longa TaxID=2936439 RepID=UPI0024914301